MIDPSEMSKLEQVEEKYYSWKNVLTTLKEQIPNQLRGSAWMEDDGCKIVIGHEKFTRDKAIILAKWILEISLPEHYPSVNVEGTKIYSSYLVTLKCGGSALWDSKTSAQDYMVDVNGLSVIEILTNEKGQLISAKNV